MLEGRRKEGRRDGRLESIHGEEEGSIRRVPEERRLDLIRI